VTTSQWSHIAGIPVAVIGLITFRRNAGICSRGSGRTAAGRDSPSPRCGRRASALYLIWIELFRVDAVCIWCTLVHICTLALLCLTIWRLVAEPPEPV
jgi:uncharacterized membrane protein